MTLLNLIGWIGSALVVLSLLQSRLLRLRVLNLAGCVVVFGFNAVIPNWPMAVMNAALALINGWHLWRMLATRHDDRTYEVVEIPADDAFLTHFLRFHGKDVSRSHPRFTGDAAAHPGSTAFLLVNGDEAVGAMQFHSVGDGVAQVDLDYVKPRYQDLTPGEFVFRGSRYFADHGYHTVITPPGMLKPYYGRLGFQRQGESYVWRLPDAS
ncbi:hypothetical protein [Actinoplanes regularis]|uniref:hypothetical protein n=1 Tax=Actinoplanes regularis TaxID=52697 RepID=UPI0024A607F2|nr:hypothetical protein [Actinoplanes regularis]GLW35606.1 hypothetical protein Areg01_85410 [Actinoplanes regularis]